MDKLTADQWKQVCNWMYRNARPVDLARWKYHFENGSSEDVIQCLQAYQNEDGGFGNALEADSWNPGSSPYTTSVAVDLLNEVKFKDGAHPLVKGILRYLEQTNDFTGTHWTAIIPSNNHYPRAPWWTYEESAVAGWGYMPTARLAGFVLLYADKESGLYKKAEEIAKEAVDTYINGLMPDGQLYSAVFREGEVVCMYYLLECLEAAGLADSFNTVELRKTLKNRAGAFIERDTSKWSQYCYKPSAFVTSPDCLFYEGNEDITNHELDYILSKRNPGGVWDIVWSWGAYEKEFSISENWWKGNLAISNLLLLRSFDRICI